MRKNITEEVKLMFRINPKGNWNYKGGGNIPTKHIANFYINDDMFCLTHLELLELIKVHILADKLNVQYINSKYLDTGEIKAPETLLIDKIKEMLNEVQQ